MNKIYAITTNDKYEYTALIKEATGQLNEYFNGERKVFDLFLDLTGTSFQIKVWQELLKILYGETKSYKDVGINNSKACWVIGMANNKNRVMIVVPCHWIIDSNKKISRLCWRNELKEQLLNLEKNLIKKTQFNSLWTVFLVYDT